MVAAAVSLDAATTATWEMNTYQDFLKGRFDGLSLDHDGRLTVAPKLETVFSSGQPAIWSIARAPDGSIYAGTGHRGRVYQITASGKSTLVWTPPISPRFSPSQWIPAGVVYAATSPDGKVYRIEKGKATEFFAPQAKYIWALAFANDGTLFVGAGNPGNIYRVDKTGKAEMYYETGPIARHRAGVRFARKPARRHRAQRHSLPDQRQGQSLRTLQREPSGDSLHHSHAGRRHLCVGSGRLGCESHARRSPPRSVLH